MVILPSKKHNAADESNSLQLGELLFLTYTAWRDSSGPNSRTFFYLTLALTFLGRVLYACFKFQEFYQGLCFSS